MREWLARRSYDYAQFTDPVSLARRKRNLGLSVSVLLPCLEAVDEVWPLIDEIHTLNECAPLVDQIAVITASSSQDMNATHPGIEVYSGDELMPEYGPVIGKGDAMWRALSIARGDLVVYADVEAPAFKPHFVRGVLGPILGVAEVKFAKAAYELPVWGAREVAETELEGALDELMARPLLNLYYPELSGFLQPLSGEFAAPRELLCSIPFFTGSTTEMTIMIDLLDKVGLDAMAQVNFGIRWDRRRFLGNPGCESYAMLRTVDLRLGRGSFGSSLSEEAHPRGHDVTAMVDNYTRPVALSDGVGFRKDTVEIAERPPMTQVLQNSTRDTRSKL